MASGSTNAGSLVYSVSGYNATGSSVIDSLNAGYTDLMATITGATGNPAPPGNLATTGNAHTLLSSLFNYSGTNQSILNVLNPALAQPCMRDMTATPGM